MKYNATDYFRNYLMYLSKENGINLQEKDISLYLKALFNYQPNEIILLDNKIYFDMTPPCISMYVNLDDNSLNCVKGLWFSDEIKDIIYRIKLVNDKLYYSIDFDYSKEEKLNGIYFYEVDKEGNTTCKFYDSELKRLLPEKKYCNLINADDSMLKIYGFSPDYEVTYEYKEMLEFDSARAFNNLSLNADYKETIKLVTPINKNTKNEYIILLGKKM